MDHKRKPRVAVVYHFFAHYRAAIMQALLNSKDAEYVLVGDRFDPDRSIEPWQPPASRFVMAPCKKLSSSLIWQSGVVKMAMRRDIDVMIFLGNVNILSTWLAAGLARLFKKRVLFWTHGWIRHECGGKAIIRNLFYRLAHGLLLYGNRAKWIGRSNGFMEEAMYVVYNSLDYEAQKAARVNVTYSRIRQVRRILFPLSDAPVLICTSRLTKWRGLDLVLRAMSQLQKQGFDTCLLLVGDGPEREALALMANDLHLAVHFHGSCYDEDRLAELIMSANLTVAPGKVGLTAMHSLVYGTPVITHDDPDDQMPEWEAIEPGQTGDVFRRGDVLDLAEKIKKWCQSPWPDEGIRNRCMAVIERHYNPEYQRFMIDRAVTALPAK
jgi:glycosyltransferase involved in cell wall biosynthesis